MQNRLPDFFLSSSEHRDDWATARVCRILRHVQIENNKGVQVSIEPPVNGQPFGLCEKDITALVLVPRKKDVVLTNEIKGPLPVLIYRNINPDSSENILNNSDIILSAWGEIYATLESAEQVARKSKAG
jgi:hypothetical protein